jgi:hypothetical protein
LASLPHPSVERLAAPARYWSRGRHASDHTHTAHRPARSPALPYRVDVQFLPSREAPIRPLIERLSFIPNKTHWGGAFRFGYIKVPAADFMLIAKAMGVASKSFTHNLEPG